MPLTTSLFTGLTGMQTSSQMLDVVGNNIANVNTTGYKSSTINFQTQVSQILANGSAPSAQLGGSNPAQIGLGAQLAGITRNFSDGGLQPTGVSTNAAIEGDGFFIVEQGGVQRFTRDGTFTLDRDFNLVTSGGARVQGNGVDGDFNVIQGFLQDINIPIGVLTIAEATENVNFAGNLNSDGDVATLGSISTSAPMYSDAGATTPATAGDALASLFDGTGASMFNLGDVLTFTGLTRGGADVPDKTFEIGAANTTESDGFGTTLADFMNFLQSITGIDTTQAGTPGVSVSAAGEIVVEGNLGTGNGIEIETTDIIVNQGTTNGQPFTWTQTQDATGETARTTFVAYDSLGSPLEVDLTVVLEASTNAGTTWRFYSHAEDDTDLETFMGTGTLQFDTSGQLVSSSNPTFTIDRANTGAFNPQPITMNFTDQFGSVTSLADQDSRISSIGQDGTPIGTLADFSISQDGTIVGVFSNSLLRDLGRISLATFSNNEGLLEVGGNLYSNTSNSGTPQIVDAGSGGAGRVIGRAIELSNVDLAKEFINLISAQTGFSANSRVISTSQQLIQQLLQSI
ncbi:MAG: flagellar hook protein FlgE [Phycisphaerales bacterium JB063]